MSLPAEIYAVADVRKIDHAAINDAGISGYALMTRAAQAALDAVRAEFPQAKRWQIVCGSGNNGGDGYVLARLAALQGIEVLNINDLANALKPVMAPGEKLSLKILKEGKEPDQGVAYLDDGTMVVVDNAKPFIGKTKEVNVTSVLQTSAGRMIFAKPDEV